MKIVMGLLRKPLKRS
ncbi:hypothetical protein Patl1_14821 [Pistacia atlantica]|uniref:Uncharacterized protein n=1 Tax=Pistacia atlantica TaxID=434234 RepID=A0ACC1ATJ7_9ROSI|nr:hypothetical protein Patl1_14821 [Pistacia atlantica]